MYRIVSTSAHCFLVKNLSKMFWFALLLVCSSSVYAATDCNRRYYDQESFVCVCDESGCDFPGTIGSPEAGSFTRVVSSRDEHRLSVVNGLSSSTAGTTTITVDPSTKYQSILGFGGAFTDSTGLNVNYLSDNLRDVWTRSHFAPEGIEYDLCRVPIAGSDFSTYAYSYDEVVGDVDLEFFALTSEDYDLKLPYMLNASAVSDRELLIFGSPWAPPPWMKTNGMHNGSGGLLGDMWDPYSNYLVKFVEAYEREGVPIWGLTPVNEALVGFEDWPWNSLAFSAEDMRDWIKTSFGPILEAAGLSRLKLMILDHNRDAIPAYTDTIFNDEEAAPYVDGTALHWYADSFASPDLLSGLHESHPDKFILYTESCEGWAAQPDERVLFGSWKRAENIAFNILEDLENYSTGWVDWNMALSLTGGPNWAGNFVDSPTLINPDDNEFLKQPMFYAMGHFSKFLTPGSVRLQSTLTGAPNITVSSFLRPEGDYATVILNEGETAETVTIDITNTFTVNFEIDARSIETVILSP